MASKESKLEVTVTIKRNGGTPKTYQLEQTSESRNGTYKIFQPATGCPDMPDFAKLYVNPKASK